MNPSWHDLGVKLLPPLALTAGVLALAACGHRGPGKVATAKVPTTTSTKKQTLKAARPIAITKPLPAARVRSPLHVVGTADVFEAVFTLELRAGTHVLARKAVKATSGTGTPGKFTATLAFHVPARTRGELLALVASAKNGKQQVVERVPLVIAPG